MSKYVKARVSGVKERNLGQTLIDITVLSGEASEVAGSDTVRLDFADGSEIEIYILRGELIIEGD